eukprot:530233_1
MSHNIVYGQEEDFRAKMSKFGAKLNKKAPQKQQAKNNWAVNQGMSDNRNYNQNNNKGYVSSTNKNAARQPRKNLVKSKKARAMGRNEDAIKVNLDSVKAKVKFGRLVVYSVNCLANLAENKFNCEFIVEQGGIEAMREVMKHHSGNPAVMKEVARTLTNVAEASPAFAQKVIDAGLLEQCMNTLTSNPNECGTFALDIMDSVLKSAANPRAVAQRIVKNGGLKVLESALKKYPNNPDLCASIVTHMNNLMKADPSITRQLGDRAIWQPILDSMKAHPEHGKLAIAGTEALQKLALANPNYLKGIQNYGGVGIISACMQANPDL